MPKDRFDRRNKFLKSSSAVDKKKVLPKGVVKQDEIQE